MYMEMLINVWVCVCVCVLCMVHGFIVIALVYPVCLA
jgi:hypothetical protein